MGHELIFCFVLFLFSWKVYHKKQHRSLLCVGVSDVKDKATQAQINKPSRKDQDGEEEGRDIGAGSTADSKQEP